MNTDFRLPNITAKDEAGQLKQMQSYMYQLVEQLNWAMKNVESVSSSSSVTRTSTAATGGGAADANSQATFNSLKSLIIKSADIVNAYYEVISRKLSGVYVAESDFGEYKEQTANTIEETSQSVANLYENIQQIATDIENVEHTLIEVNAHIKSGLLFYDDSGAPVYGLEIGQRTEIDGVETFNKYARFTSDKLSFYDNNGNEVAYISDRKLYITDVEIIGSLTLGGFVDTVLSDGSIVTKWVGGG